MVMDKRAAVLSLTWPAVADFRPQQAGSLAPQPRVGSPCPSRCPGIFRQSSASVPDARSPTASPQELDEMKVD
jgi:hypothetical protein